MARWGVRWRELRRRSDGTSGKAEAQGELPRCARGEWWRGDYTKGRAVRQAATIVCVANTGSVRVRVSEEVVSLIKAQTERLI